MTHKYQSDKNIPPFCAECGEACKHANHTVTVEEIEALDFRKDNYDAAAIIRSKANELIV